VARKERNLYSPSVVHDGGDLMAIAMILSYVLQCSCVPQEKHCFLVADASRTTSACTSCCAQN
jgi:hypothetical protein